MNKPYKTILIALSVIVVAIIAFYAYQSSIVVEPYDPDETLGPNPSLTATSTDVSDLIRVVSPVAGAKITSPLKITGEARGNWYFEASFPIVLTDWDGRIIAEHYATAQGEWMTTDFVPFESTLNFTKPTGGEAFENRGFLILKKDNPSGLPENDAAIEIPIYFK